MSDTLEATSTAVVTLDVGALVPTQVYAPGGVEKLIADLEAKARADAKALDISTPKGRREVASLAYKVARSKTALDDMGKALGADFKKKAAAIDADRRTVRDRLDALRDEVRKPLDEFEAAEAARVKRHEDGILRIQEMPLLLGEFMTTDNIAARLDEARAIETSGFQEFTKRAEDAKAATIAKLTEMLEESRRRDAERAELERLRKEAAERAAREEAERIEREKQEAAARAAEQAKREAEEKARREAEEAERRAAAERARIEREAREAAEAAERERQRVEREKAEAEERAKEAEEKAERERIASHERALKAIQGMIADACSPFNNSATIRDITRIMDGMAEMKRDWEEFSERAAAVIADGRESIAQRLAEVEQREEERRKKAEAEREAARIEAERRAEADKMAAAEEAARLERERIEAQRRAEEEAARQREADKAHRGRINRAAMEALIAAGLSEADARTAVEAIARGTVPAVKISY